MIVWHDPGHGHYTPDDHYGDNHGKGTPCGGALERDLVLPLAVDVIAGVPWGNLRQYLARTGEEGPDYVTRGRTAVSMKSDLVLLHHINSSPDPQEHGLITFYDPDDQVGHEVATAIARAAPALLYRSKWASFPVEKRDPKHWTSRSWWVLKHYRQYNIPSVLIEWGHASNPSDVEALLSPLVRPAMVAAAAAGLARALELTHMSERSAA